MTIISIFWSSKYTVLQGAFPVLGSWNFVYRYPEQVVETICAIRFYKTSNMSKFCKRFLLYLLKTESESHEDH